MSAIFKMHESKGLFIQNACMFQITAHSGIISIHGIISILFSCPRKCTILRHDVYFYNTQTMQIL